MSIEELKKKVTESTLFLVRGLGLDPKLLRDYGFINAYLSDKNSSEEEKLLLSRPLYLVFKVQNRPKFNDFVDSEREREDAFLMHEYDYKGGYSVLVYEFPPEYKDDYSKFLLGQYSKFSTKYKTLFPDDVTLKYGTPMHSFWYNVFNKEKVLKDHWYNQIGVELDNDQEFWSSPYIDTKEVFDIEEAKKEEKI